jgi:hypothetical protein
MRRTFCLLSLAILLAPHQAWAQFHGYAVGDPATGERYWIEIGAALWSPTPDLFISSEALGIIGTDIDVVRDLGIQKSQFGELRLVLRPATKHKFRLHYIPIKFQAETTLRRDITFNGIRYQIGLPVNSSLDWQAWRFGYEYDVVYRDRGFAGLIIEAKYTDVKASLTSPLDSQFARARAPIPAIGGIARVYVAANVSLTGEITGFKLPKSVDRSNRYDARYVDFDVYSTLNFTNNVGVQGGYRSLDVGYRVKSDTGNLKLRGPYLAGVVRF